jgi:hypothetical protein
MLSRLRAEWLALEGADSVEIHGWLIGVACAIERQRGSDPREMDGLIAELRQSQLSDYIGLLRKGRI